MVFHKSLPGVCRLYVEPIKSTYSTSTVFHRVLVHMNSFLEAQTSNRYQLEPWWCEGVVGNLERPILGYTYYIIYMTVPTIP